MGGGVVGMLVAASAIATVASPDPEWETVPATVGGVTTRVTA